ncbi:MAG: 6-bladed beta-propeller [Gemmatimonadota bacterium]|nr:6-bladed beta-propeller [Gemmatimonadota bacterium]
MEGEVPYLFAAATDATTLSDGRIVVVDMASDELRVFDSVGTHLATWGGQGEGPGEFIDLYHVDRWPGDSVAAGDYRRESITVFDSDGNLGRIVRLESDPFPWDLRAFFALGLYMVTREGSVLVSRQRHGSDVVDIVILDAEGGLRGSLGHHPGWPSLVQRDMVLYQPIFSRALAVEPWAELVVVAPTDRSEIRAFTQTGTLARIVRLGKEPRTPERAHIDAYIEAQVSRSSSEDADHRARMRRDYNAVPVAERFPVFTSVIADALDHLWVEEYEVPGEEREGVLWTVVDPGGRVLGFVETPERLEIYEIGDDFILGRVRDELDVEYIQVWPLERSDG